MKTKFTEKLLAQLHLEERGDLVFKREDYLRLKECAASKDHEPMSITLGVEGFGEGEAEFNIRNPANYDDPEPTVFFRQMPLITARKFCDLADRLQKSVVVSQ